jgi:hypothetical protein
MNERTFYLPAAMVMLVALGGASCANGRNPGSAGGASGVTSSTLGSNAMPTKAAMTSNSANNSGGAGDGGPNNGGGANGGPNNGGGANGGGPIAAGDAAGVRAPLPEELLHSLLGCWRLGDQEEWTITRTKEGGARVARRLLDANAGDTGYARRAAIPSDISYDPRSGSLVFSTAGPQHALRFIFTAGPAELTGSWASSRAPGAAYHLTGSSVTLRPCGAAPK